MNHSLSYKERGERDAGCPRLMDGNGKCIVMAGVKITCALAGKENVMSCSLKEVARVAGVSTATVSRAVNDSKHVSYKTRTSVLSAVSKLQYRPNAHAVELGRANGGIPRPHGTHLLTPGRIRTKLASDPGVEAENMHCNTERLRLLEGENLRLRRLATNLNGRLAMWRTDSASRP